LDSLPEKIDFQSIRAARKANSPTRNNWPTGQLATSRQLAATHQLANFQQLAWEANSHLGPCSKGLSNLIENTFKSLKRIAALTAPHTQQLSITPRTPRNKPHPLHTPAVRKEKE